MTASPRIVLALDKFKGSLTASEANAVAALGVLRAVPEATLVTIPVADGGDGTLAAALAAGFDWHSVTCTGPTGRPVESGFATRVDDDARVAVVELADACGLLRVPSVDAVVAPRGSSSRGLGEVMLAALDWGCTEVVVGLGGSASTDGGAGLLQALGLGLFDSVGRELAPGLDGVVSVARVSRDGLDARLVDGQVRVVVASDVASPLLGDGGAAAVFGPQKGLSAADVVEADLALERLADLVEADLVVADLVDVGGSGVGLARDRAGAGAAGGVGWALLALGVEVRRGVDVVLGWSRADEVIAAADLVITGEGSLDQQSLQGKAPMGVADLGRAAGVPVVAVCGRLVLSAEQLDEAGFAAAVGLTQIEPSSERCMAEAAVLVEVAVESLVRRALGED